MSIKNSKEAYLRPFDVEISLVFGFKDVQNDGDSVLIVVSDDALICVGGIRLYYSAFFLRCFCGLVIFQLNGFGV